MKTHKLLGFTNAKTEKGEAFGWLTGILYLAPHTAAGRGTVCSHASPACAAACLFTAGRAELFPTVNAARIRKTHEFFADRRAFADKLAREIRLAERRAQRNGMRLAIRLNGTSDLNWQNIVTSQGITLFETFPDVQFYDYTKNPHRISSFANYDLTFSRSETNEATAATSQFRVAVVFDTKRGHALPETYLGRRVIDGDKSDLRFLEPNDVVVGLRAKGRAKGDTSGFVVATSTLAQHVAA